MNKYPKFEKVDENTIKIIVEKANNVPLAQIIQNRETMLKQKAQLEQALKNVDDIIAKAKELGIKPKKKTMDKESNKK